MPSQPRRSAFFWFVVLACPAYAALAVFTTHVLVRDFRHTKDAGWTARADDTGWFVATIDPAGAAAGRLERGDRLSALNGDTRAAVLGPSFFVNVPIGETYRVDLERRDRRVSVELLLRVGPGRQLWTVFLIVSMAFFVSGSVLGLLRPRDAQVRLFSALTMTVAFGTILETLSAPRP